MTSSRKSTIGRDLALLIGLPLALSATLFFACFPKGSFDSISDLTTLQRGLMSEFNPAGVTLNVRPNGSMTILLVNSSFAGLDSVEGGVKAKAIARYARTHWTGTPPLTAISVGHITTSGIAGLSMTRTETPYTFTAAELGSEGPDSSAAPLR